MKIERLSDGAVFEAVQVPKDVMSPAVPIALLGKVERVEEATTALWVFTATTRLPALAGEWIVFDANGPIDVYSPGSRPKRWALLK